jgi:hypothetical protein
MKKVDGFVTQFVQKDTKDWGQSVGVQKALLTGNWR